MKLIGIILLFVSLSAAKILDLSDLDTTLINEELFSPLYNLTMEWGVYKPDLYFGIKNRQKNPLSIGMFWYQQNDPKNISYAYVMDKGVSGHYEFNDASSASRQVISDVVKNVNFTIEFLKEIEDTENPDKGFISRWTANIKVEKYDKNREILGRPVFFIAKEGKLPGEDGFFKVFNVKTVYKVQHSVGSNIFEQVEIGSSQHINESSMLGIQTNESMSWQLDTLWDQSYDTYSKAHGFLNTTEPNIVMIKPTETAAGYSMIIHYSKQKFNNSGEADAYSEIMNEDLDQVTSKFQASISHASNKFDSKYQTVFGDGYKDLLDTMPQALQFGKEAIANLFAGMGYFYGPIRIKNETDPTGTQWFYDEPAGLFTCTPSRPYFPRGFLWDEGFHSQLTCQWSKMICMDIISHWFNSIKENGWIPREQMRGKEAEINLDWELVEDPKAANPPSFIFVLEYLTSYMESSKDQRVIHFMTNIFPRIELWFSWFNTTLSNTGDSLIGTYMWRDVYKEGALSSGLDDYPRGYRVAQAGNIHADLQIWMIIFSEFMAKSIDDIQNFTHQNVSKRSSDEYRNLSSLATQQFYIWCYNEDNGLYTDRIFYVENPKPTQSLKTGFQDQFPKSRRLTFTKINELRKYERANDFSPHQGIVNLWPVAFNMFEDNAKLESTLQFAVDNETMFSPYGLRGVSKRDIFYFPGTGYWRGPVWISVNYIVLRGLKKYFMNYVPVTPLNDVMKAPKDLYEALRRNLVQAVYDNWEPEHLFYENFNDVTGKGQYSHPFTGWTTLILLIMSERYI